MKVKESIIDGQDLYKTPSAFQQDLEKLINYYSQENGSNTPDFILAKFLNDCLNAFNEAIPQREKWYGREEK